MADEIDVSLEWFQCKNGLKSTSSSERSDCKKQKQTQPDLKRCWFTTSRRRKRSKVLEKQYIWEASKQLHNNASKQTWLSGTRLIFSMRGRSRAPQVSYSPEGLSSSRSGWLVTTSSL